MLKGFANPKRYVWKTTRSPIRSDVFQLALQLSLGLPISEKRQEAKKKEAAKREAAGRKAAEASLERDEPKLFSVLQRLRQLGRTAEEDQFHRATLEHVAGHGGRGIKRSGHLR